MAGRMDELPIDIKEGDGGSERHSDEGGILGKESWESALGWEKREPYVPHQPSLF